MYLPSIIRNICSQLNMADIWLCRYYFDNTYTYWGTNPEWDRYMQKHGWHKDGVESLILPVMGLLTSEPQLICWSSEGDLKPNTLHYEIRQKTGAKAGHNYIIKHSDHVENIGFSTKKSINDLQQSLFTQRALHMELLLVCQDYHRSLDTEKHTNLGVDWDEPQHNKPSQETVPLRLFETTIQVSLRQAEVFIHLCRGLSYKEVGQLLNISPRTIEFHVNHIRSQLHNHPLSLIIREFHNRGYYDILRVMVGH